MATRKEQLVKKPMIREPTKRAVRPAVKEIVKGPRGRPITRNAGIFKIMGIGESKEPDGFSWRKHDLGI